MFTGAGVTKYSSRGMLTAFEVGHLDDARTLAAAYEAAPTWHHLLGVDLRQDLALAALAGEDQRAATGVADGLQRHVVHCSRRAGNRSSQQQVQPEIPS